jgi:hypothetical protein
MNAEQLFTRPPSPVGYLLSRISPASLINHPRSNPTTALSMSKGSILPGFQPSTLQTFKRANVPTCQRQSFQPSTVELFLDF